MADLVHICLNPVAADRAADFEKFLSDVVAPAVRSQRPELADRWKVLRPASTENSDGILTYAFVFEGGDLDSDWELGVLLPAEYGEEEATRLVEDWAGTFGSLRSWADATVAAGQENGQAVWSFTPAFANA